MNSAPLLAALTALLRHDATPTPQAHIEDRVRVLVVDDNETNRKIVVDMLAGVGLEADIGRNGVEAIDRVRTATYDLIFMDVQMPLVDGLEATRAIRKMPAGTAIPIIALTAGNFVEDRERCLAAGMSDHLAKPFEPEDLYAIMERWLHGRFSRSISQHKSRLPSGPNENLGSDLGIDFARGLQCTHGDVGRYIDLLRIFVESSQSDLSALAEHRAAGDGKGAARAAHSLAGAAGLMGLTRVQELASDLETLFACNEGDAEALALVIQREVDTLDSALAGLAQSAGTKSNGTDDGIDAPREA